MNSSTISDPYSRQPRWSKNTPCFLRKNGLREGKTGRIGKASGVATGQPSHLAPDWSRCPSGARPRIAWSVGRLPISKGAGLRFRCRRERLAYPRASWPLLAGIRLHDRLCDSPRPNRGQASSAFHLICSAGTDGPVRANSTVRTRGYVRHVEIGALKVEAPNDHPASDNDEPINLCATDEQVAKALADEQT